MTVCTCCDVSPLAVACESMVVRTLEVLGKRIVRHRGAAHRWRELHAHGTPWHEVYLRWSPTEAQVNAALNGAWDRLPELCERWGAPTDAVDRLTPMLDAYVRHVVEYRVHVDVEDLHRIVRTVTAGV